MTKREMADHIANELMEELGDFQRKLTVFGERFLQYGNQFADELSETKRIELGNAFKDFLSAMQSIGEEQP